VSGANNPTPDLSGIQACFAKGIKKQKPPPSSPAISGILNLRHEAEYKRCKAEDKRQKVKDKSIKSKGPKARVITFTPHVGSSPVISPIKKQRHK